MEEPILFRIIFLSLWALLAIMRGYYCCVSRLPIMPNATDQPLSNRHKASNDETGKSHSKYFDYVVEFHFPQ